MNHLLATLITLLAVAEPAPNAQRALIEGIARTSDGKSAQGVLVCVVPDPPVGDFKEPVASARSDSSGAFRLSVPDGTYMLSATAAGWAAVLVRGVKTSSSAPAAALELTLATGGRVLSGQVTSPSGQPAPGSWVWAITMTSRDPGVFEVATGDDGRFVLQVPPGPYMLAATQGELESASVRAAAAGDAMQDLRLQAAAKGAAPQEVIAWLRASVIPLASVSAGTGFQDMEPLKRVVGDARVVALGEATHGTREFFQLKHRMLEFLVRRMGFTVFAIEASLPDALAVDDYVERGVGDPAQALAGLGFWTWNTEEVLEMIRWMRRYNEEPTTQRKVRFVGFDMQAPSSTADRLAAYMKKVDPPADVTKLIDALSPLLAPAAGGSPLSEDDRAKVRGGIAALDSRLQEKKSEYLAASSPSEYTLAVHLVELLRQASSLRTDEQFLARDRGMADNVRWILDQEPRGTRMVLWAHNGHVTFDDQVMGGGSMGLHLRRALGKDYLAFGFAFDHGSFQAIEKGNDLHPMTVGPAKVESLDAALAGAGTGIFALDLRKVPAKGPVADWFRLPRPARSVGALFDPANESSFYIVQSPLQAYDALLFVTATSSAIPTSAQVKTPQRADAQPAPPLPESVANLNFEADSVVGEKAGWFSPTAAGGYRVSVDETAPAEGKRCARIDREGERTQSISFGNLMQRVSAEPYRGKKVRFKASVRAEVEGSANRAQLWLRVDRPNRQMGFFNNMGDRPIHDPAWKTYEIVGDVAPDAVALNFGVMLVGEGRVWIDGVTIEVVEPETGASPTPGP